MQAFPGSARMAADLAPGLGVTFETICFASRRASADPDLTFAKPIGAARKRTSGGRSGDSRFGPGAMLAACGLLSTCCAGPAKSYRPMSCDRGR